MRIPVLVFAAAVTAATTLFPAPLDAQGRRGVRHAPRRGVVVVSAYYRPTFYDPFYSPWYRPGWYQQVAYGQAFDQSASLRIQVSPRETEVFADGYYAGIVDDYDGIFQRLHLEPGEHEISLYLDGYRTVTERLYLQPHGTSSIRHTMEALPVGAPAEPRPTVSDAPRQRIGPRAAPRAPAPEPDRVVPGFGGIAIQVQPADAEVLIDGERWEGPESDEVLVVQVAPGPHRVEIRKASYRSYATEVDVRAGETSPLNVSLPRQ